MSDDPDQQTEMVAARLMRQQHGFTQGLGLDHETTRGIVARVIAHMPSAPDDDRLERSRHLMLIAPA